MWRLGHIRKPDLGGSESGDGAATNPLNLFGRLGHQSWGCSDGGTTSEGAPSACSSPSSGSPSNQVRHNGAFFNPIVSLQEESGLGPNSGKKELENPPAPSVFVGDAIDQDEKVSRSELAGDASSPVAPVTAESTKLDDAEFKDLIFGYVLVLLGSLGMLISNIAPILATLLMVGVAAHFATSLAVVGAISVAIVFFVSNSGHVPDILAKKAKTPLEIPIHNASNEDRKGMVAHNIDNHLREAALQEEQALNREFDRGWLPKLPVIGRPIANLIHLFRLVCRVVVAKVRRRDAIFTEQSSGFSRQRLSFWFLTFCVGVDFAIYTLTQLWIGCMTNPTFALTTGLFSGVLSFLSRLSSVFDFASPVRRFKLKPRETLLGRGLRTCGWVFGVTVALLKEFASAMLGAATLFFILYALSHLPVVMVIYGVPAIVLVLAALLSHRADIALFSGLLAMAVMGLVFHTSLPVMLILSVVLASPAFVARLVFSFDAVTTKFANVFGAVGDALVSWSQGMWARFSYTPISEEGGVNEATVAAELPTLAQRVASACFFVLFACRALAGFFSYMFNTGKFAEAVAIVGVATVFGFQLGPFWAVLGIVAGTLACLHYFTSAQSFLDKDRDRAAFVAQQAATGIVTRLKAMPRGCWWRMCGDPPATREAASASEKPRPSAP